MAADLDPVAEIARLNKIIRALMNRAERETNSRGSNYSLFETTVALEGQVHSRTRELEAALRENERVTRDLQRANERLACEKEEQQRLLRKLEDAHCQLLQSEKLASIGQLAAGVAHEINNPISFVDSNLHVLERYVRALLRIVDTCGSSAGMEAAVRERIDAIKREEEFEFLRQDIVDLIAESIDGSARVRRIVQGLRDFSRVDAGEWEAADLHQCIESTLTIAWNEIKFKADVVRDYADLPPVRCMPARLNQVFMNLLVNAAHAIPRYGTITIRTGCDAAEVWVAVSDDGVGITPEVQSRLFDPFFTTKPVGQGTGLGLALSYGIVERHGGRIEVSSREGQGSTFTVRLPLRDSPATPA